MTDTTPEAVAGMVEKLLRKKEVGRTIGFGSVDANGHGTMSGNEPIMGPVNPDGGEAAAMLTALSEEVGRLKRMSSEDSLEIHRLMNAGWESFRERCTLTAERDQAREDLERLKSDVESIAVAAEGGWQGSGGLARMARHILAKHT